MQKFSPIKRHFLYQAGAIVVWLLIGLLFLLQGYFYAASFNRPFDWLTQTPYRLSLYFTWGLFSIPLFYLFSALALRCKPSFKLVLSHLAIGLPLALLHRVIGTLIAVFVSGLLTGTFKSLTDVFTQRKVPIIGGALDSFILYVLLVLLFTGYIALKQSREKTLQLSRVSHQLAQSQLASLRAQLQPHFLFNTLNGIVALISSSPEKAELMVTRLARLLRFSLDSASQNMIPLSQELMVLNDYLVIEKTRIGERLTHQVDVSEDCLTVKIPTLLLQPLVENAVRYGIAPFTHNGTVLVKGRIIYTGTVKRVEKGGDKHLCLEINDSGEGCSSDFEPGIGLCNSRERLETLYQGKASLEIGKSDLGGAKLTLLLPMNSQEHT